MGIGKLAVTLLCLHLDGYRTLLTYGHAHHLDRAVGMEVGG